MRRTLSHAITARCRDCGFMANTRAMHSTEGLRIMIRARAKIIRHAENEKHRVTIRSETEWERTPHKPTR